MLACLFVCFFFQVYSLLYLEKKLLTTTPSDPHHLGQRCRRRRRRRRRPPARSPEEKFRRGAQGKNERAGGRLCQDSYAQGGADQRAGEAAVREGGGNPGAEEEAPQMPVGAARALDPHRPPDHPGAGHLGRTSDVQVLPRPATGVPEVHQV